jgi:uncharacterized spore protein YtfJ
MLDIGRRVGEPVGTVDALVVGIDQVASGRRRCGKQEQREQADGEGDTGGGADPVH